MGKRYIFIILFFLILRLNGQNIDRFKFEVGLGFITESTSSYALGINMTSEIKYELNVFDFGLKYELGITSLGSDSPRVRRNFNFPTPSQYPYITNINVREGEYSNLSSIQVWVNYNPKLKKMSPILGIGFSRNKIGSMDETIYDEDLSITKSKTESTSFNTLIYKFGYKINDIRYYLLLQNRNKYNHKRFLGMGLAYDFSFNKNSVKTTNILAERDTIQKLLLRIEGGVSIISPIGKYNGPSHRYFIGVEGAISNKSNLGIIYESEGWGIGIDKNTLEITENDEINDLFVRETNVSSGISSIKSYYQRVKVISSNIDFYYGGGLGIYSINNAGEFNRTIRSIKVYYPPEINRQTNLGILIRTGYRMGIFCNRIEINIPFGEIPTYIGFHTGIGFNHRKKKEK